MYSLSRLLNKALRDTAPSVKEIELLDGSFKAVTSNETHRDVMVLDDDAPDIVDCQVPMESEVCPTYMRWSCSQGLEFILGDLQNSRRIRLEGQSDAALRIL